MSAMVQSFKHKWEMARKHAATIREKAKQTTHAVVEVGACVGTSGGLGALDIAKGTAGPNDMGIKQHKVGPVPTSALVGGVGLVAAMMMNLDSMESKLLLGIASGGIGSAAYVQGQRMWLKHQQGGK